MLRSVVATLSALYLALFGYFVYACWLPYPVYDFLDWVDAAANVKTDIVSYLLSPHNSHRIVLSRILTLLDIGVSGGTGIPFLLFGLSVLIAALSAVAWEVARHSDRETGFYLIAGAVLCLAASHMATLYSMPANGVFAYCASFAVLSFVCLPYSVAGAIALALMSVLAHAGGLLVLPVLAWSCWRQARGWVTLAAIGVVCLATFAVYFSGNSSPPLNVTDALLMVDYVIRLLGLPWSHSSALVTPSRLIGGAVLVLGGGLLILDAVSSRPAEPIMRLGLSFILFGCLVAAVTAASRYQVAIERPMPVRYSIYAEIVRLGLIFCLVPSLISLRSKAAAGAVLALLVVLSFQQIFVGRAAAAEVGRYRSNWHLFTAGIWNPDMLHYVFPDRARAASHLASLRERSLYGQ